MIQDPTDIEQDPDMATIRAGSHSRLSDFEACPRRAELKYIKRIPEPPRPLPPGKTEHANDRGTRVHKSAEQYVGGGVELIQELHHFAPEMAQLRELAKLGNVSMEGEWAFNRAWEAVAWMSHDAWVRVKTDVTVFMTQKHAVVIDYKTGKRWSNEVKHAEQMNLYQLSAFLRYPKLETVTVELWYTDQNELHPTKFRRDQGLKYLAGFEARLVKLTTATEFPPKPNKFTCKWCPYKPTEQGGTGHCPDGVS
jgi:RecB family exonuclease